ncbi:MAG TPA: DNA polymerase III subunit beta [Cyanobacteria bacterium UBA11372]|nr:DNA polymerase III subunit beta [Cyanobacteria bacterium UBA11372]
MKLVCTQNDLNTNLSLVSRAVPSKPTHPVLANVLLSADEEQQRVSLTAFDLSLGIRTCFAATVEAGGTLTLPAKLLNDIVSRLPEAEITIDDEAGENLVTITVSGGRYQIRGMGTEEFPELPMVEDGNSVYIPSEALIAGLHGSLFATSSDETKQVLTGVHFTSKEDGIEFAATDGHRLAVVQTEVAPGDEEEIAAEPMTELNVTVPAKALREVERMLGTRQSTPSVVLHCDRSLVVFEIGDQRLTTRLLEGQYPAYHQLIPHQFIRSATIERKQLLSALERVSVLTDQKNNIVKAKLDSDKQTMALAVEAQDIGSGRESIPIQLSGDDIEIGFNVKYLMDSLKNLTTPEVEMELGNPLSPVVLKPVGGAKATHIIMPVQIRS